LAKTPTLDDKRYAGNKRDNLDKNIKLNILSGDSQSNGWIDEVQGFCKDKHNYLSYLEHKAHITLVKSSKELLQAIFHIMYHAWRCFCNDFNSNGPVAI